MAKNNLVKKKKRVTTGELLGLTMGCMGMTYDDFCRLTPEEFEGVYKFYSEKAESLYKDGWERMRMQATLAVQPHVKKRLTPKELLPFPWEKKRTQEFVLPEKDKRLLE